jgi:hypothetical protein
VPENISDDELVNMDEAMSTWQKEGGIIAVTSGVEVFVFAGDRFVGLPVRVESPPCRFVPPLPKPAPSLARRIRAWIFGEGATP